MADEWPILTLQTAAVEIIDGGKNYPKTKDFSDAGYCLFLNARNVRAEGFDFSECVFISPEKDDALGKGKLRRDDVVMTTRGTVGNIAYYDKTISYEHLRINSGMFIFRADESQIIPRFLYLF